MPRPWRLLLALGLGAVLLGSPTVSRHAAMPRPLPERTFVRALNDATAGVRSEVPPGARVFVFGNPLPTFLAGAELYLRQTSHYTTLVTSSDRRAVQRSGLWGRDDLEQWLGHDARYAVIEPGVLAHLSTRAAYAPLMARMRALLYERFDLRAEIGDVAGVPRQEIYVRRGAADRSRAGP